MARPLKARAGAAGLALTPVSPLSAQSSSVGALNVYDASLGNIRHNLSRAAS